MSDDAQWGIAIALGVGLSFAFGVGLGLNSHPPRMERIIVAARVTSTHWQNTTSPHITTAQLGVHMSVNTSELVARSTRHWQCVFVQWNADRQEWTLAGNAPNAACVDP